MHDFLQNLSFNSQAPFTLDRPAREPLRAVLRSFNEVPHPACRPSPRPDSGKSKIPNQKSRIHP